MESFGFFKKVEINNKGEGIRNRDGMASFAGWREGEKERRKHGVCLVNETTFDDDDDDERQPCAPSPV